MTDKPSQQRGKPKCEESLLNANRFSGSAPVDSSSLGIPLGGEERASGVYKEIHEHCERQSQQRGKPKCEESMVGIDRISFYTPSFCLDLKELAQHRGFEPTYYFQKLRQEKMAVVPPDEDIVTMGANAASMVLETIDKDSISMLLFCTESGFDKSKSAGMYIHRLLSLPSHVRVLELKQACYSATGALQLACDYVRVCPDRKVLLIASDVCRYGLNHVAEATQGAGAVAMVITTKPHVLIVEQGSGVHAEETMDFWCPIYSNTAFVKGRYSSISYLQFLEKAFLAYQKNTQRNFSDHHYFCYHASVGSLVEKAHKHLLKLNQHPEFSNGSFIAEELFPLLAYSRNIGNCYTASLYLSLLSLLHHTEKNLEHCRIGFYSYGSGAVSEFFSGQLVSGYLEHTFKKRIDSLIQNRTMLSVVEYERIFQIGLPQDGSEWICESYQTSPYRLQGINDHQRQYESMSK